MNKIGSIIGAAVIGFVAGILLAPKSGKETQADLRRHAQKMKEQASERFENVSQDAKERGRRIKDLAEDSAENVRQNAKSVAKEVSGVARTVHDEATRRPEAR